MGVASLILSIIGLVIGVVGLIPLLGVLNWIALIFGLLGFIFGIIPIAKKKRSGVAIAGFVISILVLVIAIIRLILGGGIV
ncbi:hypothetical protein GX441_05600 [bacterium]|nr:hypothetical protein [bacterium]